MGQIRRQRGKYLEMEMETWKDGMIKKWREGEKESDRQIQRKTSVTKLGQILPFGLI
jgi:hypothetical protein